MMYGLRPVPSGPYSLARTLQTDPPPAGLNLSDLQYTGTKPESAVELTLRTALLDFCIH
jgi:hypothetical protein